MRGTGANPGNSNCPAPAASVTIGRDGAGRFKPRTLDPLHFVDSKYAVRGASRLHPPRRVGIIGQRTSPNSPHWRPNTLCLATARAAQPTQTPHKTLNLPPTKFTCPHSITTLPTIARLRSAPLPVSFSPKYSRRRPPPFPTLPIPLYRPHDPEPAQPPPRPRPEAHVP